jgi:hypothetical protein
VTLQSVLMRVLPLPRPGRCFADGEWRTLARAAEVMLPTARDVPPEDVADNVERFLVRGRSRRAWRVRVLMHLVEFLPVAEYGKPFSRMTLAERRHLVETRYVDGRGLWGLAAKIRFLVLLGAYGDARMNTSTGFVPVSTRRRLARAAHNGTASAAP